MKRFWCCRDLEGAANEEVFLFVGEEPPIMDDDGEWGNKWLYEGSVAPVKYDDEWNTSDEETDDSTWIGEFDLRATYGVGFVESLPDIANGEMTEIRIKYTAEKCE